MKIQLLSHTNNPELLVASSAKLCYSASSIEDLMEKQTEEGIEKFVNMLMSLGHESPLEHVSFTFGIEGVSRITEQQLTRHRMASYSIQSGRYVKKFNPPCRVPVRIKESERARMVYNKAVQQSIESYNKLIYMIIREEMTKMLSCLEDEILTIEEFQKKYPKNFSKIEKIAIENARYVLPQGMETKIICTMNLRSLINFTRARSCNRAQEEIRELSDEIVSIMRDRFPLLGKYLGASCEFGNCPEGKMSCGKPKERI